MQRSVFAVVGGVGLVAALACGGTPPEEKPEPPEPAPVEQPSTPNPLVFGQEYWFDKDLAGRPEWDVDYHYQFQRNGQCRFWEIEATFRCTWEATEADGKWTVKITSYTDGVGPDGEPYPRDSYPQSGTELEVSADGQRLIRTDGQTYVLQPGEGKTGKGGKAGKGKSGKGKGN